MEVTLLMKCLPGLKLEKATMWIDPVNRAFEQFDISTPLRQCHFLGQIGHESASLSVLEENLNYSAQGLMKTFPAYFKTMDLALRYQRNPQMIANRVYANRMGNGPEGSGDGWRNRGMGPIQLTGKEIRLLAGKDLGFDFIMHPESLLQPLPGMLVAGWYWHRNGLNFLADKDDVTAITKKINGGINGLSDRVYRMEICKKAMGLMAA